jgi:hypothetical protein
MYKECEREIQITKISNECYIQVNAKIWFAPVDTLLMMSLSALVLCKSKTLIDQLKIQKKKKKNTINSKKSHLTVCCE